MIISFHKKFKKRYKKYPTKLQVQVDLRIQLFVQNQYNPILENHQLHGRFSGKSSINITGNIRAIYSILEDGSFEFKYIGTHPELYE